MYENNMCASVLYTGVHICTPVYHAAAFAQFQIATVRVVVFVRVLSELLLLPLIYTSIGDNI